MRILDRTPVSGCLPDAGGKNYGRQCPVSQNGTRRASAPLLGLDAKEKNLTYRLYRDIYYMMARRKQTMTEVLKKAIADSGETFLAIERATGIKRASIMRFMRGEQSLRLDLADKLATYFSVECRRT